MVHSKDPRTVDELLRLRARDHAKSPFIAYPTRGGLDYHNFTPLEIHQYVDHVARIYDKIIPRRCHTEAERVVAFLGPSNMDFMVSQLALSRLGLTVLLLSPRLPINSYAHLLTKTKARYLIYDAIYTKLVAQIGTEHEIPATALIDFDNYCNASPIAAEDFLDAHLDLNIEYLNKAWVFHSSGSTGHPKPIYQTHKAALHNYSKDFGLKSFTTMPLFHVSILYFHGSLC